jgi:hypothetical protein
MDAVIDIRIFDQALVSIAGAELVDRTVDGDSVAG